jgi:endo-1,3-1,4-beta-glycanase ExoK
MFKRRIALAAVASMLAAPAHAQTHALTRGFVDTFGRLEHARWRIADGWDNGDWTANNWRASQVRRTRPGVEITLARSWFSDKRFASGELQSEKVFRYGYFEAQMRVPRGTGLVTGFFTFARPGGETSWNEIDIEILGRDTRHINFTTFSNGERNVVTMPLPFDAAEGEHTYGFEWRQDAIRWYIDGILFHELTSKDGPLPRSPQRLYLNLWNSETLTDWLGPIATQGGPWRLQVSCVAYSPDYSGAPLCPGEPVPPTNYAR